MPQVRRRRFPAHVIIAHLRRRRIPGAVEPNGGPRRGTQTARALLRLGGGAKPTGVSRLAYSPDGKTLAWAGSGPVCLYDPAAGKLLRSLKIGDSGIRCLAFSPDGKVLAVGEGPFVHVVNTATGEEAARFKAHENIVFAVAFAPDGKTLATGGDDDHVGLWDPAAGKERSRLDLHTKGGSVLAFSPDGKALVGGGEAGELMVWRMEDEDERRRLQGREGAVGFAAFFPDSGSFLWMQGKTIRVSEMETWVELSRYDGRDMAASCYALSPTARRWRPAVNRCASGTSNGRRIAAIPRRKDGAAAVAFAPDGKTLALAGLDGTVLVWDLKGLPKPDWKRARAGRRQRRRRGPRRPGDEGHAGGERRLFGVSTSSRRRCPTCGRPGSSPTSTATTSRRANGPPWPVRAATPLCGPSKGLCRQTDAGCRWRLELLLARLKDALSEDTAKLRAAQVLETIGGDDARQVLEYLAKGRPYACG